MSSSGFAALCSAFGRYDVVHIHAEGPAFFAWLPKLLGKRVVVTIHGECEIIRSCHNRDKSCMAGFVLKNTLSDNGGVTRGICKMDEQNNLTEVVETKRWAISGV